MSRRGQILFFLPAFLIFLVFVLIPTTQTLVDSFYAQDGSWGDFTTVTRSPIRHFTSR